METSEETSVHRGTLQCHCLVWLETSHMEPIWTTFTTVKFALIDIFRKLSGRGSPAKMWGNFLYKKNRKDLYTNIDALSDGSVPEQTPFGEK